MAAADTRAARRYAASLFLAAQQQAVLDQVENDLHRLKEYMQAAPILNQIWLSPLVTAARKRDAVSKALEGTFHPLTMAFLRLLIIKRREDCLNAVQEDMQILIDKARHLLRAEAVFAVSPTPQEQDSLRDSLAKRTGNSIELTVRVDPSILGGVLVRLGDTLIDGSVRGSLERLREQMLQQT